MTSVLMTFETPFCVFVREVECCQLCGGPSCPDDVASWDPTSERFQETLCNGGWYNRRLIKYHPRPGSAEAVGHWSLLSDANWRDNAKRDAL